LSLAQLPGTSAYSNENYIRYNFRLLLIFPEISGKFTALIITAQMSSGEEYN